MFKFKAISIFITRWKLLAAIPLLVLAAHVYMFPFLFDTVQVESIPEAQKLVAAKNIYLGRYRGHKISTSLADFEDPELLNHSAKPSAIVISHYISLPNIATRMGGAGRSLQSLLSKLSVSEGERFQNFLKGTVDAIKGDIRIFEISNSLPLSIRYVIVIMLGETDSAEGHLNLLKHSFVNVIKKSDKLVIETLFVPTLTIDPRHANSVNNQHFFAALFKAIPASRYPKNIQISMYGDWPNSFLNSILGSLKKEWQRIFLELDSWEERLFRIEFRSMMIFLSICLFVSAFRILLTIKNALIILITYIASAQGGNATINYLFTDQSKDLVLITLLLFYFVLALFLYTIVYWDPKKIFTKGSNQ